MYAAVLVAHGLWRWVVLGAGVAAIVSALQGRGAGAPWQTAAAPYGRFFGIAVDIQVLMGAALFFVLSPLTTEAVNAAVGMPAGSELRYFGALHALIMAAVLIDVHVSAVFIRRAAGDAARYRRSVLLYGITLVLLIAGIPWWRPLLRL